MPVATHLHFLSGRSAELRCPKPDQINVAPLFKLSYRSSVRHHCGRLWWPLVGVPGRHHGGVSVVVISSGVVTDHPGPRRCSGFASWPRVPPPGTKATTQHLLSQLHSAGASPRLPLTCLHYYLTCTHAEGGILASVSTTKIISNTTAIRVMSETASLPGGDHPRPRDTWLP